MDHAFLRADYGAWLALIEFTVVRFGWSFNIHFNHCVVQVIFAIGVSMMALAVLVYLPRWMIAATGLAMIGGHNVLDGISAALLGAAAPLWNFLHQRARSRRRRPLSAHSLDRGDGNWIFFGTGFYAG